MILSRLICPQFLEKERFRLQRTMIEGCLYLTYQRFERDKYVTFPHWNGLDPDQLQIM